VQRTAFLLHHARPRGDLVGLKRVSFREIIFFFLGRISILTSTSTFIPSVCLV
jgi:hypothetical protein